MRRLKEIPIFSSPFRILFLLTTISAFLMPALWISFFTGKTVYSGTTINALNWHIYEMIFGFGGSLLAGFLLTSSSNWAGIKPYAGIHLVLMTLLWLLERVLILIPNVNPYLVVVIGSLFTAYFLVLLVLQLRNNSKNRKVFVPLIFIFLITKVLFLVASLTNEIHLIQITRQVALDVIRLIIVLITGRIIPFFMRKKIANLQITMPIYLEKVSWYSVIIVQLLAYFFSQQMWISYLWLVVFTIHLMRQLYWKPWKCITKPMLWILHVAYLFLVLSFLQEGLKYYIPILQRTALHTFTAGAIGIFAIGMIARVSLGHTGRDIKANWFIVVIFISILIGATLRVLVPIVWPNWYISSLHYSSGFWTFAFMLTLIKFTPVWFKPRPDAKN